MSTFDGWRAVGRAMRWARQQDGVLQEVEHSPVARQHRWSGSGKDAPIVGITWGGAMGLDLDVYLTGGTTCEVAAAPNAATILRVLAALDLIPAELADPRPAVTVDHRVIMAFIQAPDEPDGDIGGPLRAAFRAAGIEVAE